MDPMKIGKQPFHIFSMKFMIWLDYASSKFPIPWLREGEKGRGKFTISPIGSKFEEWNSEAIWRKVKNTGKNCFRIFIESILYHLELMTTVKLKHIILLFYLLT